MSDKAKYERMAYIIDGPLTQTIMEFKTSPDDFNDLRRRLSAMLIAVNKLGNVPSAVCLLCSVIQNKKICHKRNSTFSVQQIVCSFVPATSNAQCRGNSKYVDFGSCREQLPKKICEDGCKFDIFCNEVSMGYFVI